MGFRHNRKRPEDSSDAELIWRLRKKNGLPKNCIAHIDKMYEQLNETGVIEHDTRIIGEVMCESVKA